jgi:hypothetical protein
MEARLNYSTSVPRSRICPSESPLQHPCADNILILTYFAVVSLKVISWYSDFTNLALKTSSMQTKRNVQVGEHYVTST